MRKLLTCLADATTSILSAANPLGGAWAGVDVLKGRFDARITVSPVPITTFNAGWMGARGSIDYVGNYWTAAPRLTMCLHQERTCGGVPGPTSLGPPSPPRREHFDATEGEEDREW